MAVSFSDPPRTLIAAAVVLCAGAAWGQRVQFPQSPGTTSTAFQGSAIRQPAETAPAYPPPSQPGYGGPAGEALVPVPSGGVSPYGVAPPASGYGGETFDPYSTSPNAADTAPTLIGPPAGSSSFGAGSPFASQSSQPFLAPAPGYQAAPPSQYPSGFNSTGAAWGQPIFGGQSLPGPYLRLFEDWRAIYTWVAGDDGEDISLNEVELATTLNIPNFVYSQAPISISPGFIFHFVDGPQGTSVPPALAPQSFPSLPGQLYSGYVHAAWNPRFTERLGAEFEGSGGVYSDFEAVNSDSIRWQGKAQLAFNVTPNLAVKGGVIYLDRVKVKLLPAGGLLWTPNDRVYFDVYFPKPKLAQYLVTLGTAEVWWYLAGEYGGGSWTVEREELAGAPGDRVDINDLRAIAGLEFTDNATTVQGFFEAGYVFRRELIFASGIGNINPDDTFMLRGGLAY